MICDLTAGDAPLLCPGSFFTGYGAIPESVRLGNDGAGRSSGEAYISFTSNAEAQRAVAERNRQNMGSRYVELFIEAETQGF